MIVSSASPESRIVPAKSRCSSSSLRVEQQAAHADDRIHRCADLVAHRRQERALRFVGGFGGGAGFARLIEKARVLNRNHCLLREGLQQRDLPLGKRRHGGPGDKDGADAAVLPDQRRKSDRAATHQLGAALHGAGHRIVGQRIGKMHRIAQPDHQPGAAVGIQPHRVDAAEVGLVRAHECLQVDQAVRPQQVDADECSIEQLLATLCDGLEHWLARR